MKLIVWVMIAIFAAGSCLAQERLPGLRYWQLRAEIEKSFQRRDYRAALNLLQEADHAVPNSPKVIFRMAMAEAFLREERASVLHLKRLVKMRVYFDLAKEPAFEGLKKLKEFHALTRAMERLRTTRRFQATEAFKISDQAFLPEGIAYDAQSGDFFIASIRERKIVRVNSKGTVTNFIAPRQDGIWGVGGIGLDTKRRILWACSTAFEANEGYTSTDRNNAALFAFNIEDGKLVGRYPLEKPGDAHFCDGLAVASDGTVFVADSAGLIIYRLGPSASNLQVVVGPEAGISPQGLALSEDGSKLFVSNYLSGLYVIDLSSGQISTVRSRAKDSLAGIDGLISYGRDLIAIQNGIQPNRVVRLKMSRDGTTVDSIKLLEINHPLFGEPTLGVINGDTLFFVANNPVTKFLQDHQLTALPDPIILKRNLQ